MNYFFILMSALLAYMSFWFIISLIKQKNDVADIAWGLGFVLLAWLSLYLGLKSKGASVRSIIVTGLVTIWGLRLATHIYLRNKGKEEDERYQKWRKNWGKWFYLRSYFQVFLFQGLLLFLISLPVLVINKNYGVSLAILDALGILVWLVGFFFEGVGDWQLKQFIENPKRDGILQSGLWKYSRHPNYFGEVTQWWGLWLLALSVPRGIWTIVGPITITVLILKVSGIPMLEKRLSKKKGFEEYKKRVSKFFPRPPKDTT